MQVDDRILKRLDEMIKVGGKILETKQSSEMSAYTYVNSQMASQWITSVRNLLARVFDPNSEYYRNCLVRTNEREDYFEFVDRIIGVLKSAKDDYENGHLFNVRSLIEAEVFDDFLEQAKHLLQNDHDGAAAVIAGGVLEDGMRKLCARNNIAIPAKPKLSSMNDELRKANVYSKITFRKIQGLADVRNYASHGEWDKFNKNHVEDMIKDVRRFMEDHFN